MLHNVFKKKKLAKLCYYRMETSREMLFSIAIYWKIPKRKTIPLHRTSDANAIRIFLAKEFPVR